MSDTVVWIERVCPHARTSLYELRVGALTDFVVYLWYQPQGYWVCRAGLELHWFRSHTVAEAQALAERHAAALLRSCADALEHEGMPLPPESEPFDPRAWGARDWPPVRFDAEGGIR